MSSSEAVPSDVYLAVLQAADTAAELLTTLPVPLDLEGPRSWVSLRARAAQHAIARLTVAAAGGVLRDYEAAVRALLGEAVPLADPPEQLVPAARTAAAQLDELALRFERSLSAETPRPGEKSAELRRAYRRHAGSWVDHPLAVLELPAVRAADSRTSSRTTRSDASIPGLRIRAARDPRRIEVLIVVDGPDAMPLVPVAVHEAERRHELLVLATELDAGAWIGNAVLSSLDVSTVDVAVGRPLGFGDLRPQHAELLRTSVASAPPGVRALWLERFQDISWMRWLTPEGLDDPRRD